MDSENRLKGSYEAIEMGEERDEACGTDQEVGASPKIDVYDNIEEPFDEDFWHKVYS